MINQVELNLLHALLIDEGIMANQAGGGSALAAGTLDYCRLHDMLVQAWSPVAGGKLFNPPDDAEERVRQAAEVVARLAEAKDTSKEAIVLAWLLRHPAPIQPIIGDLARSRREGPAPLVSSAGPSRSTNSPSERPPVDTIYQRRVTSARHPVHPMAVPASRLIDTIASDAVIDEAYAWLCERRKDDTPDADVWHLRWQWAERKPQIQAQLRAGTYRLGALACFQGCQETREVFSAQDALVLKATAIVLTQHLRPHLSQHGYHLAGRGGAKAAVRAVAENLNGKEFVFRTDVKSYYASLDHDVLFRLLQRYVKDPRVLQLLWRYVHRLVVQDGHYREIHRGIPRGCPLSPLIGALYLKALDDRMAETDLFYARFMDDWVILAPTRWKLRRAIRLVNETLAELKLDKHPDKTFIGRTGRGFDFLGYTFSPSGLGVAAKTIERFTERWTRLYEHGADAVRIGAYVRHWRRWVTGGLGADKQEVAAWLENARGFLMPRAARVVISRASHAPLSIPSSP